MPSDYVIVPYADYWCNDLPQVLHDCLVVIPSINGTGNCMYSSNCNEAHGAICEVINNLNNYLK